MTFLFCERLFKCLTRRRKLCSNLLAFSLPCYLKLTLILEIRPGFHFFKLASGEKVSIYQIIGHEYHLFSLLNFLRAAILNIYDVIRFPMLLHAKESGSHMTSQKFKMVARGNLRTFALIVSAHPYCARNSLPRHAYKALITLQSYMNIYTN